MVMDFGLSHLLAGVSTVESATNAERGSLRWQAPEQFKPGDAVHTKQSDIWALGMTYLVGLVKIQFVKCGFN